MLKTFFEDDSGATAMEYGLIAALISVSILAGYQALGGTLNSHWSDTANTISGAGSEFLDK